MSMKKKEFEGNWKNGLLIGDESYLGDDHAMKYVHISSPKKRTSMKVIVETHHVKEDDVLVAYIRKCKSGTTPIFYYDVKTEEVSYSSRIPEPVEKVLGCDTASFLLNDCCFRTGADGMYGSVFTHEDQELILLFISDDMYTFEDFSTMIFNSLEGSFK